MAKRTPTTDATDVPPASAAPPDATDAPPITVSVRLGPFSNAELAAMSNDEALEQLHEATRLRAALDGKLVQLAAEVDRREAFRERGATSIVAYLTGHCGFSSSSARTLARVGQRLFDLPHLQHALSSGELSLDQVRAVAGVAEPESDAEWVDAARGRSVADVSDLAQRKAAEDPPADAPAPARRRHTGPVRRSVRFNDKCCTMTAQLPKDDFVAVRAVVDARVKEIGADAETPLDERAGDALITFLNDAVHARAGQHDAGQPHAGHDHAGHDHAGHDHAGHADDEPGEPGTVSSSVWTGGAAVVVAHVALETLLHPDSSSDADGSCASSNLLAELEDAGLVSIEVVRRLACDASLVVALNDAAGHTMYEGRARRFPTQTQRRELWRRDRHCRFPGCSHARFIQVHHVVPWKPDGRTDLDNLVTLCTHHHHEIHSKRWSVHGDANVELTFVRLDGWTMSSRPSPLWCQMGTVTTAGPGREADV